MMRDPQEVQKLFATTAKFLNVQYQKGAVVVNIFFNEWPQLLKFARRKYRIHLEKTSTRTHACTLNR